MVWTLSVRARRAPSVLAVYRLRSASISELMPVRSPYVSLSRNVHATLAGVPEDYVENRVGELFKPLVQRFELALDLLALCNVPNHASENRLTLTATSPKETANGTSEPSACWPRSSM